jgi:D-alanyl-D-alanine carboxypeptidase
MNDSLSPRLVAELNEAFHLSTLAGMSVALATDAEERWEGSAGHADTQGAVPIRAGDLFLVYSLTKTYIAAAVLKLAEAGLVDLDVPVAAYLPGIPSASEFTVRQALNHTAGLPDYGSLPEYHRVVKRRDSTPWTFDEFIERTMSSGLAFAPGQGWGYSNIGYMLLGRLVEGVTKLELAAAMERLVFRPLNLGQTMWVSRREQLYELVAGHSLYLGGGDRSVDARDHYDPRWVAHSVIASTAAEVVTFYHELFEGRFLSRPMLEQMLELIAVGGEHPYFVTPSYGLGVMADPDSRYGPLYGHTGGGPGYSAAAYHLDRPEGGRITVAVLSNSEDTDAAEGLILKILGILLSC